MFDVNKLDEYKKNPKMQFLVGEYERLLNEQKNVEAMIESDPEMAEMAKAK